MWPSLFLCLLGVLSASAFSKYGRSCKDIGCLNSETCIMAEEPCSYGRTSECGSYPTCKKKSATDLANSPVEKPSIPKPIAPIRPAQPASGLDDLPNYAPPPPPRGGGYGGSSGGYGGGSNGGYGGGSNGGYGGGSSGGYGGGSSGGYGNHGSGTNGGGLFGNTNGGSSQGGGFSDSLGSLFGNAGFGSLFGNNGSPGSSNPGSAGANGGTNPITSILSGLLSNFTKNGLPSFSTLTRPGVIENKNSNPNPYGANTYGYNDPNAGYNNQKQGIYPSLNSQPSANSQGQPTQQNGYVAKNYGQSSSANAKSSAYTTRRSVNYGWTLGVGLVFISLTKFFI